MEKLIRKCAGFWLTFKISRIWKLRIYISSRSSSTKFQQMAGESNLRGQDYSVKSYWERFVTQLQKQNAEDLRRVEAILFSMQMTSLYAMKIVKVVFLFVHLHKPFTKPNCTQILLFLLGQLESRQPVLYGVHTTEFLRDKFCYFNLTAISFYLAICFIYLIKQQLALRNYLK